MRRAAANKNTRLVEVIFSILRRKGLVLGLGLWTVALLLSLLWNLHQAQQHSRDLAATAARVSLKQIQGWRTLGEQYRLYVPLGQEGEELKPILREHGFLPAPGWRPVEIRALLCQLVGKQKRRSLNETKKELIPFPDITYVRADRGRNQQEGSERIESIRRDENGEWIRVTRSLTFEESCRECHDAGGTLDFIGSEGAAVFLEPYKGRIRHVIPGIVIVHLALWLLGAGLLGVQADRERRREGRWRKQERDLRSQRDIFHETVNQCPWGMGVIHHNIITFANPALAVMVGHSPEEVQGTPVADIISPEALPDLSRQVARVQARQTLRMLFESALRHPLRTRLEVEVHLSALSAAHEEECLLAVRDVTATRRREEETRAAYRQMEAILNGITETVMVFDANYKPLFMNRSAKLKLSPEQEGALPASIYYRPEQGREGKTPEFSCPLKRILQHKKPCVVYRQGRTDSKPLIEIVSVPMFDDQGEMIGIIEVGRFLKHRLDREADLRQTEREICRQEKDEAIARLAGGAAHHLNNILAIILGNSELLRMKIIPASQEPKIMANISEAARRMSRLTHQLLVYAKRTPKQARRLSLNLLLQEAVALSEGGKGVEKKFNLETDLWPVWADHRQLRHLFIEIILNAYEALAENGGRVLVQTSNVGMKGTWTCGGERLPAGDYVRVMIVDTGPGIPEEIQGKILDPFFSTKFVGRGLGLAAGQGIMESHGGGLRVTSKPGMGCTVELFFPRAGQSGPLAPADRRRRSGQRRGKILIVDDDAQMVRVLQEMIQAAGHEVLTAASGGKALHILEQYENEISLVILDCQMPGMDGRQLYGLLKARAAGTRVLISTGLDREEALAGLRFDPDDAFLQKPYSQATLLETVKRLLAQESPQVEPLSGQ